MEHNSVLNTKQSVKNRDRNTWRLYYHDTAESVTEILHHGFQDCSFFLDGKMLCGVPLWNRTITVTGYAALSVSFVAPRSTLALYKVVEDPPVRGWCIPARLIEHIAVVRVLPSLQDAGATAEAEEARLKAEFPDGGNGRERQATNYNKIPARYRSAA